MSDDDHTLLKAGNASDNFAAASDDDDEIVDLLEVVKVGKKHSADTAAGADAAEAEDEDFSADLDAMLERLAHAEKALDDQAGEPEDDAVPFPDPTPVDHVVDPDEALDMPDMDDLDSLLNTLGADVAKLSDPPAEGASHADRPAAPAASELDAAPLAVPLAAQAAAATPPVTSPDDDPFAKAQAAAASPATPAAPADPFENALAAAVPHPAAVPVDIDDLPLTPKASVKQAAQAHADPFEAASAAAAASAPADPVVDPFESASAAVAASVSVAPAPAAPVVPAAAAPVADPFESASPAVAASAPTTAGEDFPVMPKPETAPPAPTTEPANLEEEEPAEDIGFNDADLEQLDALLDDMLTSAPGSGPSPATVAATQPLPPPAPRAAPQATRTHMDAQTGVGLLEVGILGLQAELREKDRLIAAHEAQIAEQHLAIKDMQAAIDQMKTNLEKTAAEAAAKVIREELTGLLRDM